MQGVTAQVAQCRWHQRSEGDQRYDRQVGRKSRRDHGSILWHGLGDGQALPPRRDGSCVHHGKAAVCSFARTWTSELRDRRIRVNAISPGHIDTPIFEGWQQGEALTKMKEDLAKSVPLGRMGDPDDIAKAVAFLASDDASYISGIELFVDGGVAQI